MWNLFSHSFARLFALPVFSIAWMGGIAPAGAAPFPNPVNPTRQVVCHSTNCGCVMDVTMTVLGVCPRGIVGGRWGTVFGAGSCDKLGVRCG